MWRKTNIIIRPAGESDDNCSDDSDYDSYECTPVKRNIQPTPTVSISNQFEDAITNQSVEQVKKLLDEIKDLSKITVCNGWNPVTFAAHTGNSEILQLIMEKYPLDQIKDAFTPLMAACQVPLSEKENMDERKQCIKLLLAAKIDIDFKDRYGVTALMLACKSGRIDIVEHLLANEANVNEIDNDGWTALFYAVNGRYVDITSLLIKNHANTNKVDKRSRKAYDIAHQKNYPEIMQLLEPTTDTVLKEEYRISEPVEYKLNDILESDNPSFHESVVEFVFAFPEMERYGKLPKFDRMTLRELLTLKSDEKLKEIGIQFSSHRNMLLRRIRQFHLTKWSPASFGLERNNETNSQYYSLLNFANFFATLYRQMYSLQSTFLYVKDDIFSSKKNNKVLNSLTNTKLELISLNERLEKIKLIASDISCKTQPFLHAQRLYD